MPDAGKDRFDPQVQPAPDYEFDQRVAWQVPREDEAPLPVTGRLVACGHQADLLRPVVSPQAVGGRRFLRFFMDAQHEIPH